MGLRIRMEPIRSAEESAKKVVKRQLDYFSGMGLVGIQEQRALIRENPYFDEEDANVKAYWRNDQGKTVYQWMGGEE